MLGYAAANKVVTSHPGVSMFSVKNLLILTAAGVMLFIIFYEQLDISHYEYSYIIGIGALVCSIIAFRYDKGLALLLILLFLYSIKSKITIVNNERVRINENETSGLSK